MFIVHIVTVMSRRLTIHPFVAVAAILAVLAMLAYAIFGGHKQRDILGAWIPLDSSACAFQCGKQGLAASIGSPSVQYTNWELSKNRLLLKGKRFSKDNVSPITDTLYIKKLNSSALTVTFNDNTIHFRKTN